MTMHNHHGHAYPADKMYPLRVFRGWSKVTQAGRVKIGLPSGIRGVMKKRHRKKQRAYNRSLCRR